MMRVEIVTCCITHFPRRFANRCQAFSHSSSSFSFADSFFSLRKSFKQTASVTGVCTLIICSILVYRRVKTIQICIRLPWLFHSAVAVWYKLVVPPSCPRRLGSWFWAFPIFLGSIWTMWYHPPSPCTSQVWLPYSMRMPARSTERPSSSASPNTPQTIHTCAACRQSEI